ncbi:methyltransferase domain-containing protein [Gallaecimonas sp. GXIMD4217]|uniref:methyltransferase domain-containing protein n=1 Tax=Gallaecimonas sp. GXIMD4217 TaxID=3131927 RepID=UPI00311B04DE
MTALPEVASAFGRAAEHYDGNARLQQRVADWLLAQVDVRHGQALDLGCGTGYCLARLPQQHRLGVDISAAMLAQAKRKAADAELLLADAQALPLADDLAELVVSSLALQWCPDLEAALAEAMRVLRPGGQLLLALPLKGSLKELALAWGGCAGHLLPMPEAGWLRSLLPSGAELVEQRFVCHYPDLGALRQGLKGVGAHHVPNRARGLTGKGRYRAFVDALEAQRTPDGLPLTYQVGLIRWQKPSS